MSKKEKTQEQLAEENLQFWRAYSGFKRSLKVSCKKEGLRSVELKLEFLRQNPKTILPRADLDYKNTLLCFEEAIQEYKSSIE